MNRIYYRSVFISDTHLGFRGLNVVNLLSFLKSIRCDYLYLVGDIFDIWAMKKRIYWDANCTAIIRQILKMAKHGTKIVYLPGNHDDAIRAFLPFAFGTEIEIVDETFHTTLDGKRYLIIHGDQFDTVVGHMKWLARLGSTVYDWLLIGNDVLHKIRVRLGYHSYWSLAAYLKHKAKSAVSFIKDFEGAVIHHAIKNGCDGVICGHIHHATIEEIEEESHKVIYANCGDWVESLTALVENTEGHLELIRWHDLKAVSSELGEGFGNGEVSDTNTTS
jgi:UDP-2,3-diacylglucosamine pyrophosphatase LpxH